MIHIDKMRSILIKKILETNDVPIESIFEKKGRIYTFLNPVSYIDAQKQTKLYGAFDGIFADGSILVTAIKIVYGRSVKRRSFDMTSMAPLLFNYAQDKGNSVYIIASQQEQVKKTVEILMERYPRLNIIGFRNGYFKDEDEKKEEIRHVVNMNPDFLVVGMGVLMQEEFILKIKNSGYKGIGFTCGGFVHQMASNGLDYYPKWLDRANMRFLFRMWNEPHTRMRYLVAGVVFPIRFLQEKFFGNYGGAS